VSYWLTAALAILEVGFLVRVLSFFTIAVMVVFQSRKANDFWGLSRCGDAHTVLSVAWEHAVHHASSGDLDRRGMGDVWGR